MATLTFTVTAPGEAGALIRRLGRVIETSAINLPDRNSSGASVTCVIDSAPASGFATVTVSGGGLASSVVATV